MHKLLFVQGLVIFILTNIDTMVLFMIFAADRRFRHQDIAWGQFLGMAVLILGSALLSFATVVLPLRDVGLLGLVPLGIGMRRLYKELRDHGDAQVAEAAPGRLAHARTLVVALVTVGSGADNVCAYVPFFSLQPASVVWSLVSVFLLLAVLWCLLGLQLTGQRLVAATLQRFGRVVMPWFLMALGLSVLVGTGLIWA